MRDILPVPSHPVNGNDPGLPSGSITGRDDVSHLVLLGTAGGPTPKLSRSAPAQAIVAGGLTYLFDAGNGVTQQLVRAGLSVESLRAVGITHHHSDHVADVGTVVQLAWGGGLRSAVDLFGPPPLNDMLRIFADFARVDLETRTQDEGRPPFQGLVQVKDVLGDGTVFADDNVRVIAARVDHPPMIAYAYRVETASRTFVISGDTAPCDSLINLAQGADVLIHEVMHVPSVAALLVEVDSPDLLRDHLMRSHTSTEDVGKIAKAASVRTLVLSHLVPTDAPIDRRAWVQQAEMDFGGPVILGEDLMWL
jgi:ribonuclease BN (tRNA processing enzyme)